ncbi:hypothetical protein SARC_11279 [Sphaeroforma arctica JP610]|uniref:General stress protein FMN-binding split barrel domain-containing protein n=1 Tax=Sphaeroforma arctica JP610 TaxID=667725 RepID=A0A0L0FHI3_9EUKA|nr:hypothetical protein SARC_11279 [Sphaeroforma arctica JP610]KNC76210.1 hypothetical protein SARC_11279 [Sphaeroforma arctica JP610]|eukprot:XP_014150112.1 hypothetical protein SARC_11279 [Sphaeroforma arctica JP610]
MSHAEAALKLKEKLNGVDIAMLTTQTIDGHMASRPMWTSKVDDDGVLWFFTSDSSGKIKDIQRDSHVNLAYSNPGSNLFVSVSGRIELVEERAKMEELWSPSMKAWFSDGLDTPDIGLLKVTADFAEYWDTTSSTMIHLYGVMKATLTGEDARGITNNEKMEIRGL